MSFTSTVPAAVPSVFQSSSPSVAVVAVKNSVFPTAAYSRGVRRAVPSVKVLMTAVPAVLPSVFESVTVDVPPVVVIGPLKNAEAPRIPGMP